MKTLRVAIVGCGRMGKERARTSVLAGAEVSAVCDADPYKARELGNLYGARTFDAAGELPFAHLDAVFVCTPPGQRGPVECAAIHAGVPFLVEKPIGTSVAAVEPLLEALEKQPVTHAVGYMNRYRASVQHARRVLAKCRLLGVVAFWVGRKYGVPWWLDPQASGGPVNEQAIHMLDLCRYLAGEVEAIEGVSRTGLEAAAALRFRNGCLGTVFYSCEASDKQIGFRIIAAEGGLELSGWDLRISFNSIDQAIPRDQDEDIFRKETGQFLAAVRTGDLSLIECTFEDAWRTQRLMASWQRRL
jgi:myo-inositol 2-dehydrogenase / D-chiro-inositol 1-dehydrogenase